MSAAAKPLEPLSALALADLLSELLFELLEHYDPDRLDLPPYLQLEISDTQGKLARLHGQLSLPFTDEEERE